MEEIQWQYLMESLEAGRCIICIGPGVYGNGDGAVGFERALAKFLKTEAEHIGIRVYDDGWFHYLPNASEIDAWQRVREFYRQTNHKTTHILEKISQLPGHLFLNFTPDYQLRDTFTAQGFAYDFVSYEKNVPFDPELPSNQHLPISTKPLILNFLGELRKRNSLVMTYNDFYDYLASVFAGKSLASNIRKNIYEADYFIFLGMPFDKWYIHLFMRILQQHENGKKSKKYAANIALSESISTHCAEQYTMTFVNTGIDEFIHTLHQKFSDQQALRTAKSSKQFDLPYASFQQLLMDNQFGELFETLHSHLEKIGSIGKEWRIETMQLQGRYSRAQQEKRRGTIDQQSLDLEMNRVRMNVLELLDEIQQKLTRNA